MNPQQVDTGHPLITPFAIDPFLFVAATRYAIRRYFTDASERVCNQVAIHAGVIKTDPGAVSAILREIEDFELNEIEPMAGVSKYELAGRKARWREVGDRLR